MFCPVNKWIYSLEVLNKSEFIKSKYGIILTFYNYIPF